MGFVHLLGLDVNFSEMTSNKRKTKNYWQWQQARLIGNSYCYPSIEQHMNAYLEKLIMEIYVMSSNYDMNCLHAIYYFLIPVIY